MRPFLIIAGLLGGLSLLALPTARAAEPAAEPDSYVLLVGIEQYADSVAPSLGRLPFARQDLDQLREVLPRLDGFAHPAITELWQEQAVKANVSAWLAETESQLKLHPERSALVYFTGHGLEIPDLAPLDEADGCDEAFVLYDFALEPSPPDAAAAARGLLLDDELAELLARLPDCRRFVFIADSCHSGGLSREGGAGEQEAKRVVYPELAERGLVTARSELVQLARPSELVILAAQDGESALVSNQHQSSMLTYALHRALVEDAAGCDRNGDGSITLDELRFYLGSAVDQAVQAEYNMKGQQVQIASGAGDGLAAEAALVVAVSNGRSLDTGAAPPSFWTPLAIQYVAQALAAELDKLPPPLPAATAAARFSPPLRSGDGVGWTLQLDTPASVWVVSFDGKGNAVIVEPADYGAGLDWGRLPAGEYALPGGAEAALWPLRFERAGLEFAAVLLLPPDTTLRDYPALRDLLQFGYRQAATQAARAAAAGTPEPALPLPQRPGLLILPYEVQL
jgi:hypothetical protein